MLLTNHVEGDSTVKLILVPNTVNGLLHFAMTTIATLDGVRSRGQQFVVEKGQSLVEIRGEQFVQRLAESFEPAHALSEFGEFGPRCVSTTAAIEQSVHFVHDLPEGAKLRLATGNSDQRLLFRGSQIVLNEQITMIEQIGDLVSRPLLGTCRTFRSFRGRAAAGKLRYLCGEFLAKFGDRAQHRLGQLGNDMELTDLVRHCAENLGNRPWIQVRTVCRDSVQCLASGLQSSPKTSEEGRNICLLRAVIEDFVHDPLERAVVHQRQHAIWSVVQFVRCYVAGEVFQCPVEIVSGDMRLRLFSPRPRPSSGLWRRERTRDGRARDANWPIDMATRPPPPAARPN